MTDEIEVEVNKCLKILRSGGIILYPTDTIWGIGCDATNETAVEKIYKLKKRSLKKSMVILLDSETKLLDYVADVPEAALQLILTAESPTTVIYNEGRNLAGNLLADDHSIAIRIVSDLFCQSLINKFGKPIVSTSANISNEPSPANFTQITSPVLEGVDYVVNLQRGKERPNKPSRIIKLDNKGHIIFIRH